MRPFVSRGCFVSALLYSMSMFPVSADETGMCDLSPIIMPSKVLNAEIGVAVAPVQVDGRVDFDCSAPVCTTRETINARVENSRPTLHSIILENVGKLPQDRCGARIDLDKVLTSAPGGLAHIDLPLNVEQWGCAVGLAAKLAEGTLTFKVVIRPYSLSGRISLNHSVTREGEIKSTFPEVDLSISEQVSEQVSEATDKLTTKVKLKIEAIFDKIGQLEKDQTDPVDGQPFYHPQDKSIAFSVVDGDLVLTRIRTANMRRGTTCTFRALVLPEWEKIIF